MEECEASFVGQDMTTYAKAPDFLENKEMYGDVGELVADVLHDIYNLDLTPRKSLAKTAWGAFKRSGWKVRRVASLGIQAVRSM